MLATLADEPFAGGNWIFELKLDGYRVIAAKNGEKTQLFSRRDNSLTENYAGIAAELSSLPANFVIDGEVCYMVSDQEADFQKLQHYDGDQEHLHYYAFDILWLNGHDLQAVPLIERKKILQLLLAEPPPHIHFLEHVENDGLAFFEEVRKKRGEGMIAKRADSPYSPGIRSKDWFKVKTDTGRRWSSAATFLPKKRHDPSVRCSAGSTKRVPWSIPAGWARDFPRK